MGGNTDEHREEEELRESEQVVIPYLTGDRIKKASRANNGKSNSHQHKLPAAGLADKQMRPEALTIWIFDKVCPLHDFQATSPT
jgi:hypothetical protein